MNIMKYSKSAIISILIAVSATSSMSAQDSAKTSEKPAEPPKKEIKVPLPEFKWTLLPRVAAKVKGVEISGQEINLQVSKWLENEKQLFHDRMQQLSDKKRIPVARKMVFGIQKNLTSMPQGILAQKIRYILINEYLTANKVQATPAYIANVEQDLAGRAKKSGVSVDALKKQYGYDDKQIKRVASIRKMNYDASGEAQIDALIAGRPDYFNGTLVKASHILIKCPTIAPTTVQQDMIDKLKQYSKDIQSGKSKFEDIATEISMCSSAKKGGNLGEFKFSRMTPPFSVAAFGAKPGEIVGPIRTSFGFHLILVTGRKEGESKVDPKDAAARTAAKRTLSQRLHNAIYNQALTTCPIEITNPRTNRKK